MPRRSKRAPPPVPTSDPEENAMPALAEDDFVLSLKCGALQGPALRRAGGPGRGEGAHGQITKRLLQDLWEVHNQFEDISVHLTIEPSQTLFATFVEYPDEVDVQGELRLRRGQDDRAPRPDPRLARLHAPLLVLPDPRRQAPHARHLRVVRGGELPPLHRLDADDEPGGPLRCPRGLGRLPEPPPGPAGTSLWRGTTPTSTALPSRSSPTSRRSSRKGRRTPRNRTG